MTYIAGGKNAIDTGDTYFRIVSEEGISGSPQAMRMLTREWILRLPLYDGKPLEVRIEHARLIIDCPNCNNAEFAFEDKLFLCGSCKNSDVEGKARKVKMPKERKEIEALLAKRPIKNRHWNSNQTVEDLENENRSHGLEVV